jgi:putative ABC transport system ATP-binding protein
VEIVFQGIEIQFPGMVKPLLRIDERCIGKGARLLIRGPSGTGKTTLLHVTAGLLDPNRGMVSIEGVRIGDLSESERCRWRRESAGLVFQRLNLLGHLTAQENVMLASPGSGISRESAIAALKRLGVDGLANHQAYHLSLGEQQRVAVARVIARSPRLILADEPTSSLDAYNAELVMGALLETAGTDGTLVVATHDERIGSHFSEVWTLEGGTIR